MSGWPHCMPILGYHEVGEYQSGSHVPTVSPGTFRRQLTLLTRFRVRVLSLQEAVERLEHDGRFPRGSVAITFDDGYVGVHAHAWQELKRCRFPAAVFVVPGDVGRPGFLTWDQVREMSRDGITIGCHTMNERYLPTLNPKHFHEEIIAAKQVLEEQIGRPVTFFSYPSGGFTPDIQAIVKQAGYRAALTTNRAVSRIGIDRFALRRVKMTERDAQPLRLWAKVSGYYDLFRRLRQPS